jgi:hypothetical protein
MSSLVSWPYSGRVSALTTTTSATVRSCVAVMLCAAKMREPSAVLRAQSEPTALSLPSTVPTSATCVPSAGLVTRLAVPAYQSPPAEQLCMMSSQLQPARARQLPRLRQPLQCAPGGPPIDVFRSSRGASATLMAYAITWTCRLVPVL